jgi:hypothetical protein
MAGLQASASRSSASACCGSVAGSLLAQLVHRTPARFDVLVQEGAHLALGQRAHELVHHLAADEQDHQRDAADLQRGAICGALVGVELGQHELAAVGLHQLFQHRLERLAGAAPGRPAVQQHGHLDRTLEHGLAEVGFGDVEGKAGVGRRSIHGVADRGCRAASKPAPDAQCKESLAGGYTGRMNPSNIVFIGGGNMASAIIGGCSRPAARRRRSRWSSLGGAAPGAGTPVRRGRA